MKTLELELKKDVLIVDLEDNEATHIEGYDFLCEGSELTEEIASELVDETIMHLTYGDNKHKYRSYVNYNLGFDNALDSFISAIESKGFYWLKHNVRNFSLYDLRSKTGCHDLEEEDIITKQWKEAEEKTFKNPLIFVKNA